MKEIAFRNSGTKSIHWINWQRMRSDVSFVGNTIINLQVTSRQVISWRAIRLSAVQHTACAMGLVCHSVTIHSVLANCDLLSYTTAGLLKVVPAVRLHEMRVDQNLSFRLPVNLRCHIRLIMCHSIVQFEGQSLSKSQHAPRKETTFCTAVKI
jgi:hypothetical protein